MYKRINELFDDYIKYISTREKITNVRLKEQIYSKHIKPYFKNCTINDIDETKYAEWQYSISQLKYSDNTVRNIHTCIKKFYDYLNVMYNIPNLPAKFGRIKGIESNNTHSIYTIKDFKRFIKNVDNKIYHALFNTLFYTGMRKSELLALKITDLKGGLFNAYIQVNKSITKDLYNGQHLVLPPKTKKSIRNIPIDAFLCLELKHLIKYYSINYKDFNNNFYLFGGNKLISSTTLKTKKDYYCDIAHLERIRIHDFRHSHATMLYNLRVKLKSIQERLGHQSISTTLNTYVHDDVKNQKRLTAYISLTHL